MRKQLSHVVCMCVRKAFTRHYIRTTAFLSINALRLPSSSLFTKFSSDSFLFLTQNAALEYKGSPISIQYCSRFGQIICYFVFRLSLSECEFICEPIASPDVHSFPSVILLFIHLTFCYCGSQIRWLLPVDFYCICRSAHAFAWSLPLFVKLFLMEQMLFLLSSLRNELRNDLTENSFPFSLSVVDRQDMTLGLVCEWNMDPGERKTLMNGTMCVLCCCFEEDERRKRWNHTQWEAGEEGKRKMMQREASLRAIHKKSRFWMKRRRRNVHLKRCYKKMKGHTFIDSCLFSILYGLSVVAKPSVCCASCIIHTSKLNWHTSSL